jgi:putative YhdH/YhfP family quinone oxidoreductase
MSSYRAFVVDHKADPAQRGMRHMSYDALGDGDTTIRVEWSSVNYKDALAASPSGRVARITPLVPGIDLAGEVVETSAAGIATGSAVLAHGYDLGVSHHGGFAELARVPGDWLVPLPGGLSARQAMVIGTAGYTAALCVLALEERGLTPGDGEVLVLGATGGVGSIAVSILSGRGYDVTAVTGKHAQSRWLHELGARQVMDREETLAEGKPLERERWAGCVDPVGGPPLAYALRTLRYGAAAASCGNVAGADLHTTILPFILRGISLLGIDSVQTPIARRREVWTRLATDLRPVSFERSSGARETTLDGVGEVLDAGLNGGAVGRTVVRVST